MTSAIRRRVPVRERVRLVSVIRELARHEVQCPTCRGGFELFGADWCGHADPSKTCPHCAACACARPEYRNARLFASAPPAFERRGFRRLFVSYL